MKSWMCVICGYVYHEADGLPDEGIAAGTSWDDVPPNWMCPDCGAQNAAESRLCWMCNANMKCWMACVSCYI